jgi:hypothetical protein
MIPTSASRSATRSITGVATGLLGRDPRSVCVCLCVRLACGPALPRMSCLPLRTGLRPCLPRMACLPLRAGLLSPHILPSPACPVSPASWPAFPACPASPTNWPAALPSPHGLPPLRSGLLSPHVLPSPHVLSPLQNGLLFPYEQALLLPAWPAPFAPILLLQWPVNLPTRPLSPHRTCLKAWCTL